MLLLQLLLASVVTIHITGDISDVICIDGTRKFRPVASLLIAGKQGIFLKFRPFFRV